MTPPPRPPDLDDLISASQTPKFDADLDRALQQARILGAFYRWTALNGSPPSKENWQSEPDWPDPEDAIATFGGWDEMMRRSGMLDSKLGAALQDIEKHKFSRREADAKQAAELRKTMAETEAMKAEAEQQAKQVQQERKELKKERKELGEAIKSAQESEQGMAERLAKQDSELESLRLENTELQLRTRAATVQKVTEEGDLRLSAWLPFDAAEEADKAKDTVAGWVLGGAHKESLLKPHSGYTAIDVKAAGHQAAVESHHTQQIDRWSVWWTYPEQDGHTGVHVTVDSYGDHGGVAVQVRQRDSSRRISTPGLLRKLAGQVRITDQGRRISAEAQELTREGVDHWLEGRLFLEDRRFPLMVISADPMLDIDVDELVSATAGLVDPWVIRDPEVSWELTHRYSQDWSVFGPAIRLYLPGIDPNNMSQPGSRTHPLILRRPPLRSTAEAAVSRIEDLLRTWWMQQPIPSVTLEQSSGASRKELQLWDQLQHALSDNQQLRDELAEAKAGAYRLASAPATQPAAAENGDDQPKQLPPPTSVLDALNQAKILTENLQFADSAADSAADSPFNRPQAVLDDLLALDQLAEMYMSGESIGMSLEQAAREIGVNWRGGVSVSAVGRNPGEYQFNWRGKRRTVGPHTVVGSGRGAGRCARIYLYLNDGTEPDEPREFVVARVGRHLPDSTVS